MGRIDTIKAADMLGFEQHDIAVLVQHGLLSPLGEPVQNARKYFAAVEVIQLARNKKWLENATTVIYEHWQKKNSKRPKEVVSTASMN